MKFAALATLSFIASAVGQDPAEGWLGYAQALPPIQGQRLTFMSATWINLDNAKTSSSFYSPWLGCDSTDNMNLLQPVNPWVLKIAYPFSAVSGAYTTCRRL